MSKIFVGKSQLLGTFARYAVQQSPYHRPDNLEIVLDKLSESIDPVFKDASLGIAEFEDILHLENILGLALAEIPEYVAWNDRKNGNDTQYQFTSRYDKTDPDDDFIDLDALQMNVARDIELEQREIAL